MEKDKFNKLKSDLDFNLFFAEIGKSVTLFSCLEYDLISLIQSVIPNIQSEYIFRLLGGDYFRTLLEKTRHIYLFRITNKELIDQLEVLLNELDSIRKERNSMIHGFWYREGHLFNRFNFKKHAKKESIIFDHKTKIETNEMVKFNKRLIKAIENVRQLKEKTIVYFNENEKAKKKISN